MKKIVYSLALCFIGTLCAFGFETERVQKPFHAVVVEDDFSVYFEPADKYSTAIVVEKETDVKNVITCVKNDTLYVNYNGGKVGLISIKLFAPSMSAFVVKDNSRLYVRKGISGENLSIKISGTASMETNAINYKQVQIDFNGVGRFAILDKIACDSLFVSFDGTGQGTFKTIEGKKIVFKQNGGTGCIVQEHIKSNRLYQTMNGVGRFKAEGGIDSKLIELRVQGAGNSIVEGKVIAKRIKTYMHGTGKVAVKDLEAERVDADLNGIGTIELGGKTSKLEKSISGFGSVSVKNLKIGEDEENYDD